MPVREGPPQPMPPRNQRREGRMRPVDGPARYPGDEARGGEIILRSPARRMIFIAGLVGVIVLLVALRLFASQH